MCRSKKTGRSPSFSSFIIVRGNVAYIFGENGGIPVQYFLMPTLIA